MAHIIIPVGSIAGAVRGYSRINLEEAAFLNDLPTFTLSAYTHEGPPTTNNWSRNGMEIIDDGYSFVIAPPVDFHRARLFVTGRLPGLYQYLASNRATPSPIIYTINIEGAIAQS